MPEFEQTLVDAYRELVSKRTPESRISCQATDRSNCRLIARLAKLGIVTPCQLAVALPALPPKLKSFGIWWMQVSQPPTGAEKSLLQIFQDDPEFRVYAASALGSLDRPRSMREIRRIGWEQLNTSNPDARWLDAVVQGLKFSNAQAAGEILVTIFERTDLPGWLRGDAGDALGCQSGLQDRRTSLFRRAFSAAFKGLREADIEVKFWSMYVVMQLAVFNVPRNRVLHKALSHLRMIAKTDHRIAPGLWWPLSEEAKDAIECIETGTLSGQDAGERWFGKGERGPCTPRY